MDITIYGFGHVGRGIWNFLKDRYSIQIFDPNVKAPEVTNEKKRLKKTKYAVICVPTPMLPNGECDISIVKEILSTSWHDFYLIKSTVAPGTTAALARKTKKKIAFSPEYLGEGNYTIPYWKDMPHPKDIKKHSFHIFGGPKDVTREWVNIWQKVSGWAPTYAKTDSTTAELAKYMENSFIATKKIFCDEFYDIAKKLGVDYQELRELWLLDGRVGRSTTLIYPEKRGFTGKCLPKDVNAIVALARKKGHEPELLQRVLDINQKLQGKK
ncbi:hypothetical protein A3I27_01635 [Candidatus Giovannonibacteria bacterium RIFCSPLOWO2_02_FULL_43_11b]|uniref:UDP-glucose/GDP-mannose dehydrogenase dimerisation domain-containing protein n=1 Tax=Candidatus Giovannonibacteria bacterium RIFCSPHIGHO2_12_FULL_43_15 TaxID=1798341 RepID=A0A1F5WNX2_9BACT|nr:MAG: hypothetical protein A2739_01110 [Candidatus Giovannonibacteria bacterium RIFCSPHIGHO2_01_FULL_43_100]OGF66457.1 MAG: hypothetical protein A3B97_03910 [Candidatus Giovannonibacteria bacterium RIFCSPHIGHO2_02_FULL_43_32]OGF77402.1 MAG: hypothetical protein A3F23_03695 [Candidatus Giovannonibacteria bacterium RIFCSPHIGHO2_12_FULL_43_15]OGF78428.1 MAG: hypothetical protein A3A15_03485 [Candidatus Giovannonibacteria bacterium RIFCSPLOWO2_01_FULL_43_60]OGF89787.1 MAG: hypothetical protein A3